MTRLWMLLALAMCPFVALAQSGSMGNSQTGHAPPYQPAVPVASTVNAYGGGYGGYGGGANTPAGAAMNGMAGVISAKGNYNLSTSAAAVNMTQAQSNEIKNRQEATNAYFSMREVNRQATAAERGPRPTMEQLTKIAKEGAPKKLNANQLDPVNGQLKWPGALQQPTFDDQRKTLDQLFGQRARYGALGYAEQTKVRETVNAMFDELKSQIADIPPMDYVASRSFLNSLTYAAAKSELQ